MAKFSQHPELAEKLIATGEAKLTYNNECGDTYWGVFNGEGENNLGKVLMRVRSRLGERQETCISTGAPSPGRHFEPHARAHVLQQNALEGTDDP